MNDWRLQNVGGSPDFDKRSYKPLHTQPNLQCTILGDEMCKREKGNACFIGNLLWNSDAF